MAEDERVSEYRENSGGNMTRPPDGARVVESPQEPLVLLERRVMQAGAERRAFVPPSRPPWEPMPAVVLGGQTALDVQWCELSPLHTARQVVIADGPITMSVSPPMFQRGDVLTALQPQCFEHARVVSGIANGVVATQRRTLVDLVRCPHPIATPVCHHRSHLERLVPAAKYASAFGEAADVDTGARHAMLSTAFPRAVADLTDMPEAVRHSRELMVGMTESTRFLHRLALMVTESVMIGTHDGEPVVCEAGGGRPVCALQTWNEYRRRVAADAYSGLEPNYVPWTHNPALTTVQEEVVVQVLYVAASDEPMFVGNGGELMEPLYWPEIPDAVFYVGVPFPSNPGDLPRWSFTAAEVYHAAVWWAARYSSLGRFQDILQTTFVLYWQRRGAAVRLVVQGAAEEMALPEPAMRGFLVAPYLREGPAPTSDQLYLSTSDAYKMIGQAVAAALMIGHAMTLARWHSVGYAVLMGTLQRPPWRSR